MKTACTQEILKETASFKSSAEQVPHKFNRLCFDGNFRVFHDCGEPCINNKDVYFEAGSGLEVGWWIDDLIIDEDRIGPSYFSLLAQQPLPTVSFVERNENCGGKTPCYSNIQGAVDCEDGIIMVAEGNCPENLIVHTNVVLEIGWNAAFDSPASGPVTLAGIGANRNYRSKLQRS